MGSWSLYDSDSTGSRVLDSQQLEELKWQLFPDLSANTKDVHLTVLYSASNDVPFSPGEFHAKCSSKGPTIAALRDSGSGTVLGGYTSAAWGPGSTSNHDYYGYQYQEYAGDSGAFLFSFSGNIGARPTVIKNKESSMAIMNCIYNGLVFGAGPDLSFFGTPGSNSSNNLKLFSKLSSYSKKHHTTLPCIPTAQPSKFIFEVLSVSIVEGGRTDAVPWATIPGWDHKVCLVMGRPPLSDRVISAETYCSASCSCNKSAQVYIIYLMVSCSNRLFPC